MDILNLVSGSKGNGTLFCSGGYVFLLDMGLGKRKLEDGLKELGFKYEDLKDIFITHSHSDHIKGLCYVEGCTLYAKDGALEGCGYPYRGLSDFEKVQIGPFKITCLPTSHDAPSSCGYLIEAGGKKVGYVTDTGKLKKDVIKALKGADAYIFESNHDLDMLMASSRPMMLKKRICSTKGHLSNVKSGNYLVSLIAPNTKKIALAHLSEECNTEALALDTVAGIIQEAGMDASAFDLFALRQWEETRFEV